MRPENSVRVIVDGDATLISVRLAVPENYAFTTSDAQGSEVRARRNDGRPWNAPEIVVSARPFDYMTRRSLRSQLRDEKCKLIDDAAAPDVWTVSQQQARPGGWVVVCHQAKVSVATGGGKMTIQTHAKTLVVRRATWEGHPVQCMVVFEQVRSSADAAHAADANPSGTRVADAIAICDSATFASYNQPDPDDRK